MNNDSIESVSQSKPVSFWRLLFGWGLRCLGGLLIFISLASVVLAIAWPYRLPEDDVGQIPGHILMIAAGTLWCYGGRYARRGNWKPAVVATIAGYLVGVIAGPLTWPDASM